MREEKKDKTGKKKEMMNRDHKKSSICFQVFQIFLAISFSVQIFLSIFITSCMKRNIYAGLGGGAGIPPESGLTKIRISPGEFDENIQGVIEIKSAYRIKPKDIVPVVGYGILFNMKEIKDNVFPYFGTTIDLGIFRSQEKTRFFDIGSMLLVTIGAETRLSERFSMFYEFPIGFGGVTGNALPKFTLFFGISYYFKRE